MGYSREAFNPKTYHDRDQLTKEMRYSCLFVLREIIPKPTVCDVFLDSSSTNWSDKLPVHCSRGHRPHAEYQGHVTIALLIDHNIQVPARFTDRVIRRKVDQEKNPQAHVVRPALQHIRPSDYLTAGQTSIMDQGITQEQRERVARPSNFPQMSRDQLQAKETIDG